MITTINGEYFNLWHYSVCPYTDGDLSTVDKVLCYKSENRWFDPT